MKFLVSFSGVDHYSVIEANTVQEALINFTKSKAFFEQSLGLNEPGNKSYHVIPYQEPKLYTVDWVLEPTFHVSYKGEAQ